MPVARRRAQQCRSRLADHRAAGDLLLKAVTTTIGNGAEEFSWYNLMNDSQDVNFHEGNFGLFYRPIDGVAALTP